MAGTLVVDTLTNSTAGSVSTQFVVEGSAKFWIAHNGSGTPAAYDSLNLSSILDVGQGNYKYNYVSNFAIVQGYWCIGTMGSPSDHNGTFVKVCMPMQAADVLTSSVEISATYSGSAGTGDYDYTYTNMAGLGDLA